MKVFPAMVLEIAMEAPPCADLEALSFDCWAKIAASRWALRAAAALIAAVLPPRTLIAAAELEMIGDPPRAASNIKLKVEKLTNAGEANVESIACMSAEVAAALNGASGLDSPPQPASVSDTTATVMTHHIANCSTRIGSASINRRSVNAARHSGCWSKAVKRGCFERFSGVARVRRTSGGLF